LSQRAAAWPGKARRLAKKKEAPRRASRDPLANMVPAPRHIPSVSTPIKACFSPADARPAPPDDCGETPDLLVVFGECAADYSWFHLNGWLKKVDAVDCAQRHAELWGVVDVCGQDAVQAEMAAAFTSAEPDDMSADCAAQILRRWEMADPRDRWKWTDGAPPPEIVLNGQMLPPGIISPRPYGTPQSTVDAFWYVVGLRDQERFKAWLADHPKDAPFLLKLMEGK
jgi:hypothetical protein